MKVIDEFYGLFSAYFSFETFILQIKNLLKIIMYIHLTFDYAEGVVKIAAVKLLMKKI